MALMRFYHHIRSCVLPSMRFFCCRSSDIASTRICVCVHATRSQWIITTASREKKKVANSLRAPSTFNLYWAWMLLFLIHIKFWNKYACGSSHIVDVPDICYIDIFFFPELFFYLLSGAHSLGRNSLPPREKKHIATIFFCIFSTRILRNSCVLKMRKWSVRQFSK